MTKNELIKDIDTDAYKKTCEEAIKCAHNTGKQLNHKEAFDSMIPHDVSFELWNLDLSVSQLLDIFFELYEEMPCYAYLMYLNMEFKRFSESDRNLVIDKFYEYLSIDNPILSKPIEYSLWCDYFEDNELVEYVWERLLGIESSDDIFIKKLLALSGPVNFHLKDKLYKKVIGNKNLHYSIFQSLRASSVDYYGKIDKDKARNILEMLEIDKSTDEYYDFLINL